MKFNFTESMLRELLGGNPESSEWYAAMCEILPRYGVDTAIRVAHFVSQCAHESNNFRTLEENLNYSAEVLERVFPRYFGPGKRDPREYARNPEKIANYVYMDEFRSRQGQMGNIQPGDGWRFRGRGLKQLTGRNNYTAFGKTLDMTAEEAAEYVATKKGALESALWFWDRNKLNVVADTGDVVRMTKIINGGDIGLADRQRRYEHAIRLFSGSVVQTTESLPSSSSTQYETVRVGSRGETVRLVQQKLGLAADGVFGPGTERAVKAWQAANGLAADGVMGPKSLARLLG